MVDAVTIADFVVIKGRGAASGAREFKDIGGSIRAQVPHFRRRGIDISGYHSATLNIDVAPLSWKMIKPLISVKDIDWHPTLPAENFDFAAVVLKISGRVVPALIYYPRPETKLAHAPLVSESTIEILAPYLAGVTYGAAGSLIVDRSQVVLT